MDGKLVYTFTFKRNHADGGFPAADAARRLFPEKAILHPWPDPPAITRSSNEALRSIDLRQRRVAEWNHLVPANRAAGMRAQPRVQARRVVAVAAAGQHSDGFPILELAQAHRASGALRRHLLLLLPVPPRRGKRDLHRGDRRLLLRAQARTTCKSPRAAARPCGACLRDAAADRQEQRGRRDGEQTEQDLGDQVLVHEDRPALPAKRRRRRLREYKSETRHEEPSVLVSVFVCFSWRVACLILEMVEPEV